MHPSKARVRRVYQQLLLTGVFLFSGCTSSRIPNNSEALFSGTSETSIGLQESTNEIKEVSQMPVKRLVIEEKVFQLDMAATDAAKKIAEMSPISLSMEDLHRNEKYIYLSETLPTAPERIGRIEKGDMLLFGSDCLVIFYESFDTDYTYTRIGKIREADALDFLKEKDTIQLHIE